MGRPPLELENQAVRILLECFLVFNMGPLLANEFLSYYVVIPCYKSVPRDPVCSIQPIRKCTVIHVSRNWLAHTVTRSTEEKDKSQGLKNVT